MIRPGWGPADDRRVRWTAVVAVLVSLAFVLSMWLVRVDGTISLAHALFAENTAAASGVTGAP